MEKDNEQNIVIETEEKKPKRSNTVKKMKVDGADKMVLAQKMMEKRIIDSMPPIEELKKSIENNVHVINQKDATDPEKNSRGRVNISAKRVILTNNDGKIIEMDNEEELERIKSNLKEEAKSKKITNVTYDESYMVDDDDEDEED